MTRGTRKMVKVSTSDDREYHVADGVDFALTDGVLAIFNSEGESVAAFASGEWARVHWVRDKD